jgi:hypothetical protein
MDVLTTWRCGHCPVTEALVLDTTRTPPAVSACLLDTSDGNWSCDCGAAPDACGHVLALVAFLGAEVRQ